MPTLQTPPGRMGRLWLMSRLELAERGVTLLEEKLHLLAGHRDELRDRVASTRRVWRDACREADVWQLRATLLGGERAITLATPDEHASVTIEWATTSGVRYPDRIRCTLPPADDPAVVVTGSAVAGAGRTHRAALQAAAEHAVTAAALATVEREYQATQLRARALSKHWLPRLHDELARINLELEEQDRAESSRLRLVELGYGKSAPGS
ncbi:V-type ATP synthase subunit D [Mycobacterium sp. Y57]|uniref:V-type ATP synthase subunit D n=1 Tax=Mycolicibacterium xanthum TaxID=2796469 RepID=UPI001C852EA4|nr:V-type ATP synthase subunit D [Mycolicibacterium xanthum]MBX7431082.1 V-type ATP synthase subunit D [Mycolicibacterium xanthum]